MYRYLDFMGDTFEYFDLYLDISIKAGINAASVYGNINSITIF